MEHKEMIEKLHSQVGVSREDAEDALRRSSWDMLDALTLLEKEGKIAPLTSSMTTTDSSSAGYEKVAPSVQSRDGGFWQRFSAKLKEIVLFSLNHSFIIKRRGNVILNLPVLVMVIIVVCAFEVSLAALLVGLFLDCQYSVEKIPDKNGGGANE